MDYANEWNRILAVTDDELDSALVQTGQSGGVEPGDRITVQQAESLVYWARYYLVIHGCPKPLARAHAERTRLALRRVYRVA
jgi:hypothetical protein